VSAATFAAVGLTLYAAHHVGDYWVQRDEDARHKGDPGRLGRLHCLHHVTTYVVTQTALLLVATVALHLDYAWWRTLPALAISGVTHYIADRRTPLKRLAVLIVPRLVRLGVPRGGHYDDNPQLATGLWALDQSWHIFWGVFVAALVVAA
jgi:hypothetical protein